MTVSRETRLKMLKIRAWRRGTKEMDLLLGPFADGPLRALDDVDLDRFEALMDEPDDMLYKWVSGETDAPRHPEILAKIRAFHGIG
ncbi:MAG: succinate dehydrogenase assembly factor 2 [Pseudomonadota bacterium]